MSAAVLSRLLRDPAEIAAACREDRGLRAIVTTSLLSIVAGAAAFGGVIGSFRGGSQIVYAALKVPLALLVTLAVCVPAFHALSAGLGRVLPMRSIIALSLASAGRSALVLLALSPVLWLLFDRGLGYHSAALAASFAYALAGLAALGVLVRGLQEGAGRLITTFSFIVLFFAVGGQTSWILRPYLVRPRTEQVPFLRAREGGFADSLYMSSRSARDIYDTSSPVERGLDPRLMPKVPTFQPPGQDLRDLDRGLDRGRERDLDSTRSQP
ncbi:MAG: hypothetical protein U0359_08560 [Byssovorax sp.]